MFSKIMIPVAAFAVTVTGASAFNSGMIKDLDVDLTDAQISALEEAHALRDTAREEAKEILEEVGLDQEKMQEIHEAMRGSREGHHKAVRAAIEAGDYGAYKTAVAGTPHADFINSEADFKELQEAHTLHRSGDRAGAEEIMGELGFERPQGGLGMGGKHGGRGMGDGDGKSFGGPGHGGQRGG